PSAIRLGIPAAASPLRRTAHMRSALLSPPAAASPSAESPLAYAPPARLPAHLDSSIERTAGSPTATPKAYCRRAAQIPPSQPPGANTLRSLSSPESGSHSPVQSASPPPSALFASTPHPDAAPALPPPVPPGQRCVPEYPASRPEPAISPRLVPVSP